jgi:pimeloyl-ACP methyl ester carboxylesterase
MKIFLHGLESSSKGAKATFLRGIFPDMETPDFTGSLAERMASLNVIGSSFGGLMATIFAMEHTDSVDRVVLLAPALNFPEFSRYTIHRVNIPAWMIIGRDDNVTPAEKVLPAARKIFATLHYNEVKDDHMLARTFRKFDWKTLLSR